MGRSVDYLSNANGNVTYFDVSKQGWVDEDEEGNTVEEHYDEFLGREDWNDFQDTIQDTLISKYPSLQRVTKKWDGNETSIILENNLCEIGISEYCGLASLSIRIHQDLDDFYREKDLTSLAENWVDTVWPNMVKLLDKEMPWLNRYNKQGSFSNGEGVYSKAA